MSFGPPAPPLLMGGPSPGVVLAASPPAPAPDVSPSFLAPPPPVASLRAAEPAKLTEIKNAKAYLDLQDLIQYHLCLSEYSTKWADDALVTDMIILEASLFWEGQIRVAVRDGSLQFLFYNIGSVYHGKGFEMLTALEQYCHPNTMANAFTRLMSLFNNVQGELE
jgi:hypothetical protein